MVLPPEIGAASAAALGAIAALVWYNSSAPKHPKIFVGEGFLKERILPQCPVLQQPYQPSPWAVNTHAQTALGLMRTGTTKGLYTRQLVQTSDGGTLGMDWWDGSDKWNYGDATTPVLLVIHGINGGSHEGYCKWACRAAASKGWRAVTLNMRGCNGLPLSTNRGYAATLTPDISLAVQTVKARFPQASVTAAGYSLGAIALTKYLAEADRGLHGVQGSGLIAAAAVSSPVCLFNSSFNISQPWTIAYIYNLAVAFKLREYVKHHRVDIANASTFDIDSALQTRTVAEFEDSGVPKQFGYDSRQEYYEQASSLNYIPVIKTPTLILVSEDDPFLGVLPDLECSKNPSTLLVATPHGGHVAFVQGMWPLGHAYMDDAVMEFFLVMERETRAQGSALRSTHSSCSSSAQSEATASDEDSMRASFSTDASSHSIVGQQRAPCSATSSSHSIVGQQRASCSASTTSSSFVGQQSSLQQGSRSYVRGAATRYCDSVGEQGSLQESSRSYGSGAATSSYERVGQKNSLQKGSQSFDRGLSDNPGSHNNADQHIRSLQQGSHSYGRGRSDAAGSHKIPDQHSRSLQQSSRSHGSGTPGSQASEETGALQEAVHDTGPVEDSGTPGSQASEETGALQEAVHDTGAVKDSGTPGSQASEETGAQQEAVHDTGAVEDPKAAACGTLNEVPSGSQGLHLQPAAATLKLRSGRASPALGLTAKKCGTQETQALSTALRRAPYFPKVQSKL